MAFPHPNAGPERARAELWDAQQTENSPILGAYLSLMRDPRLRNTPKRKPQSRNILQSPPDPKTPLRLSHKPMSGDQDDSQGSALLGVPRPGGFINIYLYF